MGSARTLPPVFVGTLILSCALTVIAKGPPRQMEFMNRGLVALPHSDDGVFLSWRWLGNESDKTAFNVYRTCLCVFVFGQHGWPMVSFIVMIDEFHRENGAT